MSNKIISEIKNKNELKSILKDLKKLRSYVSSMGKKGFEIFKSEKDSKTRFLVEHSSNISKDYILSKSLEIYKKYFGVELLEKDLIFIEKKDLIGGIRVFCGENMLNLSFDSFSKKIRK